MADLIGTLAAILTTISFLPQAVMVCRTGKTEGISLSMYLLFTTGVAIWLAYGVMLESWPIIIANFVTLLFASTILGLKLRQVARDRTRRVATAVELR